MRNSRHIVFAGALGAALLANGSHAQSPSQKPFYTNRLAPRAPVSYAYQTSFEGKDPHSYGTNAGDQVAAVIASACPQLQPEAVSLCRQLKVAGAQPPASLLQEFARLQSETKQMLNNCMPKLGAVVSSNGPESIGWDQRNFDGRMKARVAAIQGAPAANSDLTGFKNAYQQASQEGRLAAAHAVKCQGKAEVAVSIYSDVTGDMNSLAQACPIQLQALAKNAINQIAAWNPTAKKFASSCQNNYHAVMTSLEGDEAAVAKQTSALSSQTASGEAPANNTTTANAASSQALAPQAPPAPTHPSESTQANVEKPNSAGDNSVNRSAAPAMSAPIVPSSQVPARPHAPFYQDPTAYKNPSNSNGSQNGSQPGGQNQAPQTAQAQPASTPPSSGKDPKADANKVASKTDASKPDYASILKNAQGKGTSATGAGLPVVACKIDPSTHRCVTASAVKSSSAQKVADEAQGSVRALLGEPAKK